MSNGELFETPSLMERVFDRAKRPVGLFSFFFMVADLSLTVGEYIPSPDHVNVPLTDGSMIDLASAGLATAVIWIATRGERQQDPNQQTDVELSTH